MPLPVDALFRFFGFRKVAVLAVILVIVTIAAVRDLRR
jgi:hypothetical protein